MSVPNAIAAMRKILLAQSSITSLLLPQTAIPNLATAPIFALAYPRKAVGAAQTGYTGHDWAALLNQQAIRMVLITPAGRIRSGGDESYASWSRPRMDVQCFAPTEGDAFTVHDEIEAFLKSLASERAVLTGGSALIRDTTVEGGPLSFDDPTTECPEVVGTYGASFIEEWVA